MKSVLLIIVFFASSSFADMQWVTIPEYSCSPYGKGTCYSQYYNSACQNSSSGNQVVNINWRQPVIGTVLTCQHWLDVPSSGCSDGATACNEEGQPTSCDEGYILWNGGRSDAHCSYMGEGLPDGETQPGEEWDGSASGCYDLGGKYGTFNGSPVCSISDSESDTGNEEDGSEETSPDGSTTYITNTTTTTTTTNNNTTTIINNNGEGSGEGDEGGNSASGGGTCDVAPVCSGDEIQCLMLQQQWQTRCGLTEEMDESVGEALQSDADHSVEETLKEWERSVTEDIEDSDSLIEVPTGFKTPFDSLFPSSSCQDQVIFYHGTELVLSCSKTAPLREIFAWVVSAYTFFALWGIATRSPETV